MNAARAIAFQIHAAISGFSENIATAFKPQLIESYAILDLRRTKELMFSMSKYCYLMIFIFSLPVIVEIDSILSTLAGWDSTRLYCNFCNFGIGKFVSFKFESSHFRLFKLRVKLNIIRLSVVFSLR